MVDIDNVLVLAYHIMILLWASREWNTVFVQSSLFNDTIYKIVGVFISIDNRWKWSREETEREADREREHQINGVRDEALEGFGNGECLKWLLGERTPEYFKLIKSIEQIKRQSNGILIILGGSQILNFLCCDFHSSDNTSHHNTITATIKLVRFSYRGKFLYDRLQKYSLELIFYFTSKTYCSIDKSITKGFNYSSISILVPGHFVK